MSRAYYDAPVIEFKQAKPAEVLGRLVSRHSFDTDQNQRNAWQFEIDHLKSVLPGESRGHLFLEFAIPRMGKRADAVLVVNGVVCVIEYKVGATNHDRNAIDQTLDYALDLKNFHAGSHDRRIVPILVSTESPDITYALSWERGSVAEPILATKSTLAEVLALLTSLSADESLDPIAWANSPYQPTPTIIEAATALYDKHNVADISRSDAGAVNLSRTADSLEQAIRSAREGQHKTICFVTGVPGSGKTLAGLNLAVRRMQDATSGNGVFLSGNGPLVTVLREALARSDVARARAAGETLPKREAIQKASAFIQNIHHFRDEYARTDDPPFDRVVIFDEAQRAWNEDQTSAFMRQKRGHDDFDMSEPEFLLSVMDRHKEWCAVVCLVGGGQEINNGEVGIPGWFKALGERFRHWHVCHSDRIASHEYTWGTELFSHLEGMAAYVDRDLHLSVSLRSYRAERVSEFVGHVVQGQEEEARHCVPPPDRYPIVVTRDLEDAKAWLRERARGSERYGLVASSGALRLRPYGIDVKHKTSPVYWLLNGKTDVRSSYYMEQIATEFLIQGLELDWAGVCWDADLRRVAKAWTCHQFRGTRWTRVANEANQQYLVNAYRVLLTRARQGMAIFVPAGSNDDHTRPPAYYDETHAFLRDCGIPALAGSTHAS